jgi:hypothetical protein
MESDSHEGRLQHIDIEDQRIGTLSVFFKRVVATIGGVTAFDSSSRQILRTTGLVLRDTVSRKQFRPQDADRLLSELENEFQGHFEQFWNAADHPELITTGHMLFSVAEHGSNLNQVIPQRLHIMGRSPMRNKEAIKTPQHLEAAIKLSFVVVAVSFALSAICAYKYAILKDQLAEVTSRIQRGEIGNDLASQSRIDAIEQRLRLLEERAKSTDPRQ